MNSTRWLATAVLVCAVCLGLVQAEESSLRSEAIKALKTSSTYYHSKVASHGGYVYYYSLDLSQRWGEGKASPDILFVQPPGTPTVGMAYLKAYEATGEKFYLNAARDAAGTLLDGQLVSGGWTQVINYGPAKRPAKYRTGRGGKWNVSSLDDDQTQSALQMLMLTDKALQFKDEKVHEAAVYGLNALLKAQFANGGFPQVWTGPVEAKPVMKAKYPTYDWKTEGRVKNYWDHYTLNDGLAGTVADTLITAHQIYKDNKYKSALEKLGDFLILAQMPDPQPAWCQQYNYEMIPMWARKFEPASITGWESQDAMQTLIKIARYTENKKYLEPIPKALAYLKKSLLPDGKIARFYELKSNKPLYMTKAYVLTYDDSAAPNHYGWKQASRLKQIEAQYEVAKAGKDSPKRTRSAASLEKQVRQIIKDLDKEGRWVSTYNGERLVGQPKFSVGFRYISSGVFSRNVEVLSDYLAASRK